MEIEILRCILVRDKVIEYAPVNSPDDAVELFRAIGLGDQADESFWMLCMSTDGSITSLHEISHGDLTSTVVSPREVYKRAILAQAARVVFGHNHPSGSVNPSNEDRATTDRLKAAGDLVGIKVVDHIIVAGQKHFSFAAEGLL